MNPIKFVARRPITTLLLTVILLAGGAQGCSRLSVNDISTIDMPTVYTYASYVGTRAKVMTSQAVSKLKSLFQKHEEEHHEEQRKVVTTSPKAMEVIITEPYVCQIHSQKHIEVCALDSGYLQEILVNEGQTVKKGDLMFRILPVLYKAKLDAELAEAHLAELEYNNTENLFKGNSVVAQVVSKNEVLLFKAKLDRARAKAELAQAEYNFTEIRAPFDGIVDRRREQLGSLIKEGELLTTLSDNSVMWVYFNVTEAQYLEYKSLSQQDRDSQKIELKLANGNIFPQTGKIGAIEAQFNNQIGTIAFRADFPNPEHLLRHGQTGTILISRPLKNALVIPQRATFEILDKRYVWVVDENEVAHQTLIRVSKHELEDIFIVEEGLGAEDRIVLEGVRQVQDGEKVESEFRKPEEALKNQKFHAE